MTVGVRVDNGIISQSAPIVSKFVGQPLDHLKGWMQRQSGYKEPRMVKVSKERPMDHGKFPTGTKKKVKKKVRREPREESNNHDVALPTEMNTPPQTLEESIIMIHGEKAVGKTSLFSQFKDALVFMWERGRRNLKIFMIKMSSWEEFKEAVELFIKDDRFNFGVIDTIDNAYLACYRYICERNGITNPEGATSPYIVWDEISEEFGTLMYLIKESGKGLAFISHTKARPIVTKRKGLQRDDLEESETLQRLEPTCKPAAFRLIQEVADYVFYYGYKDGHRALTVRDPFNVTWVACGTDDRFLDPAGNPVNTFKVGTSPKAADQSLLDAFNNKLYDMDYIPPVTTKVGRRKKKRRRGTE